MLRSMMRQYAKRKRGTVRNVTRTDLSNKQVVRVVFGLSILFLELCSLLLLVFLVIVIVYRQYKLYSLSRANHWVLSEENVETGQGLLLWISKPRHCRHPGGIIFMETTW